MVIASRTSASAEDAARDDAIAVAHACLPRLHATGLVTDALESGGHARRIAAARRAYCIAVGKASAEMYQGVAASAGRPLDGGVVVMAAEPEVRGPVQAGVTVVRGTHPVPDARSAEAAAAVERFLVLQDLTTDDLVIACVSGGASAMVSRPVEGVSLADVASVTAQLLASGADVTRINAVRGRLSRLHGGGLLRVVAPAACLSLVLCDNVQAGAPAVGSGLTYPGRPSAAEAAHVIRRHVGDPELRSRVLAVLRGQEPGGPAAPVQNVVIGAPGDALRWCRAEAEARGYRAVILTGTLQGEAREVAKVLAAVARHHASEVRGPVCVLAAGEVTVTVRGDGQGGRCSELAWAVASCLPADRAAAFVALATDGRDFVPTASGAWVTSGTLSLARERGLDWWSVLARNDTHAALAALGQSLPARATGTNLCDIYVLCLS